VALRSEDPKLIIRVINFELVQPMCPRYSNVTDGQTDGRTTYHSNTALALRALRGKNGHIIFSFYFRYRYHIWGHTYLSKQVFFIKGRCKCYSSLTVWPYCPSGILFHPVLSFYCTHVSVMRNKICVDVPVCNVVTREICDC